MTSAVSHGGITSAGNIHVPYQWTYADAAARTAATGFSGTDVGKLARQLDDNSLWMLTDDSPETWIGVGGGGSGTVAVQEAGVDVVAAASAINFDGSDFNITDEGSDVAGVALAYGTSAGTPAEGDHTHAGGYTDEQIYDLVQAMFVDGTGIDFSISDPGNTITAEPIFAGTGSAGTVSHSDHTHSVASTDISDFTEASQDVIGALLTDSTSIDFTYNDAGNAESVDVKDEYVQDVVGAMVVDSSSIDATYSDVGNTLSVAVIDEYIYDLVQAMFTDGTGIDFSFSDPGNTITAEPKFAGTGSAGTVSHSDHTHSIAFNVPFLVGDGINVISLGHAGWMSFDFAWTIAGFAFEGTASGNITFDIRKCTRTQWDGFSTHPASGDSIFGGGSTKPFVTAGTKYVTTSLTGVSTAVSADDVLQLEVDSGQTPTGFTRVTFVIKATRTV